MFTDYFIPAIGRIRNDVDRLAALLERLEGLERHARGRPPRLGNLPVVAHWFQTGSGEARIFLSAGFRDSAEQDPVAVDVSYRWLHDGSRVWRMGAPSPTNDNRS